MTKGQGKHVVIEFFVFLNGDFDFNTRPEDSQGDFFYRTAGKRGSVSTARRTFNYGTRIEHDSFGRVRRVGNTFINYDSNDRVSRIGTVYMRYNRHALTQIGGMQIVYNRRGDIINMFGNVKGGRNQGYVFQSNFKINEINRIHHGIIDHPLHLHFRDHSIGGLRFIDWKYRRIHHLGIDHVLLQKN